MEERNPVADDEGRKAGLRYFHPSSTPHTRGGRNFTRVILAISDSEIHTAQYMPPYIEEFNSEVKYCFLEVFLE